MTDNTEHVRVLREMRDIGVPPCIFPHDAEELAALDAAIAALDRAAVEASQPKAEAVEDVVLVPFAQTEVGLPPIGTLTTSPPESGAAVTEAMVEAGAVGVFRSEQGESQKWECWHESVRDSYRKNARAALEAALSQGAAKQDSATVTEALIVEMAENYEMVADEGYYQPNEHERALLLDFAHEVADALSQGGKP